MIQSSMMHTEMGNNSKFVFKFNSNYFVTVYHFDIIAINSSFFFLTRFGSRDYRTWDRRIPFFTSARKFDPELVIRNTLICIPTHRGPLCDLYAE